ncbi:MAG: hypothetical protein ACLR8Y_01640 [Alistipes indistinctus]
MPNLPAETDPALAEFSIFNAQGDRYGRAAARPQEWLLVTLTDPAELSGSCRDKLATQPITPWPGEC